MIANVLVVLSIVVLEGLLSVDNALVNASLAAKLPQAQRGRAIYAGIAGGAILRLIALILVGLVVAYPQIRLVGGAYLVYLMIKHLWFEKDTHQKRGVNNGFWHAVIAIALADIAFSVDNVIAATAMSPRLIVVIIGVMAGIVVMAFATQLVARLIGRYPLLERTAYVIVGFVGISIFLDYLRMHMGEAGKFTIIVGAVIGTIVHEEYQRHRNSQLRRWLFMGR